MEMLLVHKRATQEKIESLKYVGLECDIRFDLMTKGKGEIKKKMAINMKKVLSCVIVLVVLMSVVPGTGFGMDTAQCSEETLSVYVIISQSDYRIGETVNISYWANKNCTGTLTITTPEGYKIQYEPEELPTTVWYKRTKSLTAGYPEGRWEVKLEAQAGSERSTDGNYFNVWSEERDVKFRGEVIGKSEITDYFWIHIRVESIISDPTGAFSVGAEAVAEGDKYKNQKNIDKVEKGDKVEVYGCFMGCEDVTEIGKVSVTDQTFYYLKKIDSEPTQFYIRPACQDVNGNHLNDVSYEFVDYPTYQKGTCDYEEYLNAPGQGTYWVKFTKGILEATVTLGSHTKTFTGTVVTLREEQKTGSLTVTIYPSEVRSDARWRLASGTLSAVEIDDTSWHSSGYTISNIPLDYYTLQFNEVSGWTKPSDKGVTITEGSNYQSGTYTQEAGSLTVTIYPSEVRSDARWRLASGTLSAVEIDDTSWHSSGYTISNIPLDYYTLQFNEVSGWTKPSDKGVTITEGSNYQSGTYTQEAGSLTVTIYPSEVRSDARWRLASGTLSAVEIDDTSWHSSGYTISNIPLDYYTLQFNEVSGWTKPSDKGVTITEGSNYQSGTYTQEAGSLTVTIYPSEVRSDARWRLASGTLSAVEIDDTSWHSSGYTISNIPLDYYTIQFNEVSDWTKPSDKGVTITEGSNYQSGTYTQETGSLTVTIEPSDVRSNARWKLTSGPDMSWHSSGDKIQNIPVRSNKIQFNEVSGWTKPVDIPITITEGPNSKSGTYTQETGSLTVTIEPSDVRSNARWKLTSGPDMSWHSSGDKIQNIPVGPNKIQFNEVSGWTKPVDIVITIKEGSNSKSDTYKLEEKENQFPTAYIDSITPNPANHGETVSFSGHGTDPDGDSITAYNWRSSIDGQLSTTSSFSTSSLSVGTHTIYFKVKDSHNAWSSEVTKTLVVNEQYNWDEIIKTAEAQRKIYEVYKNYIFNGYWWSSLNKKSAEEREKEETQNLFNPLDVAVEAIITAAGIPSDAYAITKMSITITKDVIGCIKVNYYAVIHSGLEHSGADCSDLDGLIDICDRVKDSAESRNSNALRSSLRDEKNLIEQKYGNFMSYDGTIYDTILRNPIVFMSLTRKGPYITLKTQIACFRHYLEARYSYITLLLDGESKKLNEEMHPGYALFDAELPCSGYQKLDLIGALSDPDNSDVHEIDLTGDGGFFSPVIVINLWEGYYSNTDNGPYTFKFYVKYDSAPTENSYGWKGEKHGVIKIDKTGTYYFMVRSNGYGEYRLQVTEYPWWHQFLDKPLDKELLVFGCPVHVTITDNSGRVITDTGINEIPNANIIVEGDEKIFYLPLDCTYSIEIDAYDSGTFNFTRGSPIENNISITKFENIPLTASTKASVDIVPEETTYMMSIDSEGDGIYESNITPDVSETIEVGPILTTIEVAPSTKTLYAGNTQQFTATAEDQYGDPMTGITIEWTSTNTAAGTVSPASATTGSDGTATTTFTASSAGTTTVKAACGDVNGTATVTVQNKPVESSPILRGGGGGGGGGGGPIDIDGDGVLNLHEEVEGTDPYDPCDPDPDCFACLAKLGLTPTPKPKERSAAMMSFDAAMPAATETATEPAAETETPEPAAATPAPKQPGFEAVFAIASLLAVAYVTLRRKRK